MTHFTDDDRENFNYWVGRIPSGGAEEATFNALALKIKHDLTGPSMAWRGMMDLYDRQQAQITTLVNYAQAQSAAMARIETTFTAAMQRLDEGLTIIEALEQYDVARLEKVIGTPKDGDTRTVIARLDDQDVDRARLRGYVGRLSFGVALLLAFVLVWFLLSLAGAAPPAFGGL